MKNLKKHIIYFGILCIIAVTFYRHWFEPGIITSGDWGFFFSETMADWYPGWQLWDSGFNFGRVLDTFFLQFNLKGILVEVFQKNYAFSERILWFYPMLGFGVLGGYTFGYILTKKHIIAFLSGLAFVLNTYTLILAIGGQISVGVAVMLLPLTLSSFIHLLNKQKLYIQVITALLLSTQALYDLRIAYITILTLALYAIIYVATNKDLKIHKGILLVLKNSWLFGIIFGGLQLYWLLPLIQGGGAYLPEGVDNIAWVERLSFMEITHGITVFHPLWPMRFFGAISAIEPLFYINIIAITAGIFFYYKKYKNTRNLLFLILLLLIANFALKGANEPLGSIYTWAFKNIPGFIMFRDPSKFYSIIIPVFSVLFGIFIYELGTRVKKYSDNPIAKKYAFPTIIALGILLLLHQSGVGMLKTIGGTFETKEIPLEYEIVKNTIKEQDKFFRTFWIPQKQRFSYFSNQNPIINSQEVSTRLFPYTSPTEIFPGSCNFYQTYLNEPIALITGTKYFIIPFDSEGEFSHKKEYCSTAHIENIMRQKSWLTKLPEPKSIQIFETEKVQDHIYIDTNPIIVTGEKGMLKSLEHLELDKITLIEWDELSDEQKDTLSNQNKSIITQYNAEETSYITQNNNWKISTNKIDTRASDQENGTITYKISIPEDGTYKIYANLRHDNRRGTMQYAINAKDPENNQNINWKGSVKPYYPSKDPEKDYYYENILLGSETLKNGETTITFRNAAPYDGKSSESRYGEMTMDTFWLYQEAPEKNEPTITWKRISSTEYKIQISDAQNPYLLNFLEEFHTGWKIRIDNEMEEGEENHIQSNIYAQSWYVEKTGDYEITLEYKPQQTFTKGILIAKITLALSLLILITSYAFSKIQKKSR